MIAVVGLIRARLQLLEPAAFSDTDRLEGPQTATALNSLSRDSYGSTRSLALTATTVAGALRAHVRSTRGAEAVRAVLGGAADKSGISRRPAVSSSLAILDVRAVTDVPSHRRTNTAVDEHRGAAANRSLRDSEIAEVGSEWDLYFSWNEPDPELWEQTLSDLATWSPMLGPAVSTGFGRAVVTSLRSGLLHLDRTDDLLIYLTRNGPDLVDCVATREYPVPGFSDYTPTKLCQISCSVTSALHVGTRENETEPHVASFFKIDGTPTIPGTTLKGLLRSRMAYILRSVGALPTPCSPNAVSAQAHSAGGDDTTGCGSFDDPGSRCLPCRVFGFARHRPTSQRLGSGARAGVRVIDSPIHGILSSRTHAPIDRFSGGVAQKTKPPDQAALGSDQLLTRHGLLHTQEVVEAGTFSIVIEDLGLEKRDRRLTLALLRLIVEDLADGMVLIGQGGTRGFGRVTPASLSTLPTLTEAQAVLREHVEEGASP